VKLGDDPRRPWIVAHRGASAALPENTRVAFREALAQGCDAVETDVRLSADGVPVLHHDATLARSGLPGLRVGDLPAAELLRLPAAGSRNDRDGDDAIPSLCDGLEILAGRSRVLLELKPEGRAGRDLELVRRTVETLRAAGEGTPAALLSFGAELLDAAARLEPGIPRVLNIGPFARFGPRLRSSLERCDAVCAHVRAVDGDLIRGVREISRPLWVYTCNDEERVEHALAAGAGAIVTDRPGWLGRLLRRRGLAG